MEKLRIVFMGTPDFAVGILDSILNKNYEVVGVITAADKPAGRGQKMNLSAVKTFALEKGLKILQPTNLKDETFLQELRNLKANCQVIVAFRMLPAAVWQMPKYGTFNLHASLLPHYRGAAPINWSIINGEEKTGVTTFFIDDKIDTGAIILSKEILIEPKENAGQLHDCLMELGSEAVLETLQLIKDGNATTIIQTENVALKTAPKLHRENCKIDWRKKGEKIYNLIRGLSPYPAAWCTIKQEEQEWNVKIYEAAFHPLEHVDEIGRISTSKKEIKVAVADGYIEIKQLQLPGKKKMTAIELLNGMTFLPSSKAL
jgi:methionyl-tRNA formyltransferase